jgi:hypothetical protein
LEPRFAMILPAPASPGSVWSPDQPLTLAPRPFGLFPVPSIAFGWGHLCPLARPDAAVALVGSFDETWKVTIARVVPSHDDWDYLPLYAPLVGRSLTKEVTVTRPPQIPDNLILNVAQ